MIKLTQYLASLGADNYFDEMKLSINELFLSDSIEINPYREHNWELRKAGGFTVVNAIPDADKQDRLFWEEWYVKDDEVHHHILSLYKPAKYDEVFVCPAKDDIHPALSFGKTWYVIEDPDMKPLLLRR
ncbi:MAG: hypothetical protein JEZ04_19540 [Spirochaetales bacterium]|nr:hypothetical protein [Spirochaetales bacterium]